MTLLSALYEPLAVVEETEVTAGLLASPDLYSLSASARGTPPRGIPTAS